jgi:hypothetical protein
MYDIFYIKTKSDIHFPNPDDKVDMIRAYSKHWNGDTIIRKYGAWIIDK